MHKPTLTFSVTPPPVNVCTKELHSLPLTPPTPQRRERERDSGEREKLLELEDKRKSSILFTIEHGQRFDLMMKLCSEPEGK